MSTYRKKEKKKRNGEIGRRVVVATGVELRPPHLAVQSTTSGQIVFSVYSAG